MKECALPQGRIFVLKGKVYQHKILAFPSYHLAFLNSQVTHWLPECCLLKLV